MKKIVISLGLIGALFSGYSVADQAKIVGTLQKLNVPTTGIKIYPSPIKGIQAVMTSEGVLYISEDGRFVTPGPLYDMSAGKPQDVANKLHKDLVASISKEAIVYKAKNQRFVVDVFTDISCTYCKKLHDDMAQYNEAGITIRYLAFPRQGPNSDVGKQMQSIWRSADRKAAFESAHKGERVPTVASVVPYVEKHFQVGRQIGITGTPTIVLPNGQTVGGYLSADKLLEVLEENQ